ncbi:MAG: SDR family oxidoreductase [Acidobacteriota bacterium]
MKTILVTGATGFLGKHLVAQLKEEEKTARLRVFCRDSRSGTMILRSKW